MGACSPRKILVFGRSETTSSAFSGMMNSILIIWEKHIPRTIYNTFCLVKALFWCWYSVSWVHAIEKRQLLAYLHQICYNSSYTHPRECMLRPLTNSRLCSAWRLWTQGRQLFCKPIDLSNTRVSGTLETPS